MRSVRQKRDQAKQGEQKTQIQQIFEVAEGRWLDSWP